MSAPLLSLAAVSAFALSSALAAGGHLAFHQAPGTSTGVLTAAAMQTTAFTDATVPVIAVSVMPTTSDITVGGQEPSLPSPDADRMRALDD
jgi:hypothetical protein